MVSRPSPVASGFEVRESKRLTDFKYEVKLWSMSLKQIERLAGCDLMKSPPSNYGDAPKRKVERVPSMVEIENIGVGDTVQSITVKSWEYIVTKINSDGFYVCDRLGTNPVITSVMHPGSVELICKANVVDTVSSELSEYLEEQAKVALDSIQQPFEPQYHYTLMDSFDGRWGVSRTTPEGKSQFLGSVTWNRNTQHWSHSRQPKYGQNIPTFPQKMRQRWN
jgi:hypothetical protein